MKKITEQEAQKVVSGVLDYKAQNNATLQDALKATKTKMHIFQSRKAFLVRGKKAKVVDHGPLPKVAKKQAKANLRVVAIVGSPEEVLKTLRGMA